MAANIPDGSPQAVKPGLANPGVMIPLGSLIRGLSCLFWGIPVVLVTSVQMAKAEPPRPAHLWFTIAGFALVLYGVHLMGTFQPQERIWQSVVQRARLTAFINVFLTPFVFWWSRFPGERAFQAMVDLLVVLVLVFLIELNPLLDRLVAMLPDETLRQETRVFTRIGRVLLIPILALTIFYLGMMRVEPGLPFLGPIFAFMTEGGLWLVLFILLLPIALTMALVWKIKELIFHSVFRPGEGNL